MHVRLGVWQPDVFGITKIILVLAILSSGAGDKLKGQALSSSAKGDPPHDLMLVPENTIIPLELKNTINSKTAYDGERIYCETTFPVVKNDHILIPAHSYVQGHVTGVDQPGHIMGKAELSIRMDIVILPTGRTRNIECSVYSLAGTRLGMADEASKADDDDKNGDVGNKQAFQAPPSGESIIDDSGLGGATSLSAASQGVGGLVLLLVSRGKQILLRPGTTLEIRLIKPLNFAPGAPDIKPHPPHLRHRPVTEPSHP